jgi:hypothetical protein
LAEGGIDVFNKVTSPITIIFNETDFEINQKFEDVPGIVLIVRPAINGLYFVWQAVMPPEVISPFCGKQLLSAGTLSFYLSMLIEMAIATRVGADIEAKRRAIVAGLCKGPVCPEFGPLASAAFTS